MGPDPELQGDYAPEPDVEKAWAEEISRRAERVMRGEASGTPGEELKARMQERFGSK